MDRMLEQERPDSVVIATRETSRGAEFVAEVWAGVNLDWREHVITDTSLFRLTDIAISQDTPTKARQQLGWQAHYKM